MAIVLPTACAVDGDTPCPCKLSPIRVPPPAAMALVNKSCALPPLAAVAITLPATLFTTLATVGLDVMVLDKMPISN